MNKTLKMIVVFAFAMVQGISSAQSAEDLAPVVVELFTSQGCSSCPPADRLLNELGRSGYRSGRIIPLAYHVDYWDRLGWKDPFSGPLWTERQKTYVRKLALPHLYTPQMVINGRRQEIGNRIEDVLYLIKQAQETPRSAKISLKVQPLAVTDQKIRMEVTAQVVRAVRALELQVVLAVLENGFTTAVPAGENAGWTIHNDFVVRRLEPAFTLATADTLSIRRKWSFNLSPTWNTTNLTITAYIQDPRTLEIHGAAIQDVPIRYTE